MRILFFGDSIVQGFWDVDGGWVESLRKHYDSIALHNLENNKQPKIFNLGVVGDTSNDLLRRIKEEAETRIQSNDRSIIVISIGANDSQFENSEQCIAPDSFRGNLENIVGALKPLTDRLILIGNSACDETRTTPTHWGSYYNNIELFRYENITKNVASKNNLLFVPIFEKFKLKIDAGNNFLADGLHPNNLGHQFIADQVSITLKDVLN